MDKSRISTPKSLSSDVDIDDFTNYITMSKELFEKYSKTEYKPQQLNLFMKKLKSQSQLPEDKYEGLLGLNKLIDLSDDTATETINAIKTNDLIPTIISYLDSAPEYIVLALILIWESRDNKGILDETNKKIITQGTVQKVIQLMDSPIELIQINAIKALDIFFHHDQEKVIEAGGYDKLIQIFSSTQRRNVTVMCISAFYNFLFQIGKNDDKSKIKDIISFLPFIMNALNTLVDYPEYIKNVCNLLFLLTKDYQETLDKIIEIKAVEWLINHLK